VLRLNRFQYVAPRTLSEALDVLVERGQDASLMAGGTDLLVNIKHRLITPAYVVAVRHLPELQGIDLMSDGGLVAGAGVTLRHIEEHPIIRRRYPALAEAAHSVSTPQVRGVGTIGGNVCLDARCNYYNQSYEWRHGIGFCMKKDSPICRVAPGGDRCWAVASADTVPTLIALGARVTIAGPVGERVVDLERLYRDDGLVPINLRSGEIVRSITIPAPGTWACVYRKFRLRQSFDFPLVGAAVAVDRDPEGIVTDARIVLTAVASYPERAVAAESILRDRALSDESISAAGQTVFKMAKPMDNTAGTIFHRKRMARVLVERALRELAGLEEERATS
jgi:4-hydroxybenzoyl-CoA reductase subunit beta